MQLTAVMRERRRDEHNRLFNLQNEWGRKNLERGHGCVNICLITFEYSADFMRHLLSKRSSMMQEIKKYVMYVFQSRVNPRSKRGVSPSKMARLVNRRYPLKTELVYILFKNSVRASKRTPNFTIPKINWLMLFKEIIAVYSGNHT
jgi:hypothetical protein